MNFVRSPWPSAFLLVLCHWVSPATAAAACHPAVILTGDRPLVREIAQILAARGIAHDSEPGCSPARGEVRLLAEAIQVRYEDPWRRANERRVLAVDTAATLIESWAHADFEEATAERSEDGELAERAQSVIETPDTVTRDRGVQTSPPRPGGNAGPFGVALGPVFSVASDRSLWAGLGATGCGELGPLCAGVALRGALDTRSSGASSELRGSRSEAEALLRAGMPLRAGRITVSPGLGAGVGWLRTSAQAPSDGADTMSEADAETEDALGATTEVTRDSVGLRVAADVVCSFRFASAFALELSSGVGVAPFANVATIRKSGAALGGEPLGQLKFGLALRYGGP
ncbi:MAG TPA: hypothetical protein VG937_07735 [Polyangiaceae bacterium]|nr:hypothetical protein [Polyangiaceae bacterium]